MSTVVNATVPVVILPQSRRGLAAAMKNKPIVNHPVALPAEIQKVLRQVIQSGTIASCDMPWDTASAFLSESLSSKKQQQQQRILPQHASGGKKANGAHISTSFAVHHSPISAATAATRKRKRLGSESTEEGTISSTIAFHHHPHFHHYDSEGTMESSSSEVSRLSYQKHHIAVPKPPQYSCLREVFRTALKLVLDHFFLKSSYSLSPSEIRRHALLDPVNGEGTNEGQASNINNDPMESKPPAVNNNTLNRPNQHHNGLLRNGDATTVEEQVFRQRRNRLLRVLNPVKSTSSKPPFTIQRVAEVLSQPERYYTKTHKLCNCLEKLLLISSSLDAFGGSKGGDTAQSRREEKEMAAFQQQQQIQERQRVLLQRRRSSLSVDVGLAETVSTHGSPSPTTPPGYSCLLMTNDEDGDSEVLEAAARASLRSKVGIDPHSAAAEKNRPGRSLTKSPPPPSMSMGVALGPSSGIKNLLRQQQQVGQPESVSPMVPTLSRTPSNVAQQVASQQHENGEPQGNPTSPKR